VLQHQADAFEDGRIGATEITWAVITSAAFMAVGSFPVAIMLCRLPASELTQVKSASSPRAQRAYGSWIERR
jgi:hypothetical protein